LVFGGVPAHDRAAAKAEEFHGAAVAGGERALADRLADAAGGTVELRGLELVEL